MYTTDRSSICPGNPKESSVWLQRAMQKCVYVNFRVYALFMCVCVCVSDVACCCACMGVGVSLSVNVVLVLV